jgi:hypothetical protein
MLCRFNHAVAVIQAALRMRVARTRFLRIREVVVRLQRWSRFSLARELKKRLKACKRRVAVDLLNLSVALAILLPIGQAWRAFRVARRLRLVVGAWRRWSLGSLHGNKWAAARTRCVVACVVLRSAAAK